MLSMICSSVESRNILVTHSIVFGIKSKKNIFFIFGIYGLRCYRYRLLIEEELTRKCHMPAVGEGEQSASRFPLFGDNLGDVS